MLEILDWGSNPCEGKWSSSDCDVAVCACVPVLHSAVDRGNEFTIKAQSSYWASLSD